MRRHTLSAVHTFLFWNLHNERKGRKTREGQIMEALRSAGELGVLPVRVEVKNFMVAAEILLSPAMRNYKFTPDECDLIRDYVMSLSHAKHPWSKTLPIKNT